MATSGGRAGLSNELMGCSTGKGARGKAGRARRRRIRIAALPPRCEIILRCHLAPTIRRACLSRRSFSADAALPLYHLCSSRLTGPTVSLWARPYVPPLPPLPTPATDALQAPHWPYVLFVHT